MASSSIPTSSPSPWRLLWRCLLFSAPFAALLIGPMLALAPVGESLSVSRVVEIQHQAHLQGERTLFGRELVPEEMRRYKLERWLAEEPEVVALGSSTIMQLRGQPFEAAGLSFLNVGGLVQGTDDWKELTPLLDQTTPKVVFLVVDPWWLNANWNKKPMKSVPSLIESSKWELELELAVLTLRSLVKLVFQPAKRLRLQPVFDATPLEGFRTFGLRARMGTGFRSDGSYRYAGYLDRAARQAWDDDFEEYAQRIQNQNKRFQGGDAVAPERLNDLLDFIRACRKRGIHVRAWLPPMSPKLYSALRESPQHRNLILDIHNRVPQAIRKAGGVVIDAMDPSRFRFDLPYFADAMHVSEVGVLTIVQALLEQAPIPEAPRLNSTIREILEGTLSPASLDLAR